MVGDEESVRALNRYRGLFLSARNTLLWMALMQFSKVFDRDPRTVSLRNLLSAAKANRADLTPHATEEELKYIEERVDKKEELLERLNIRRKRGFKPSIILLTCFGFGLLLISAFHTDPTGTTHTIEGTIHSVTATTVF